MRKGGPFGAFTLVRRVALGGMAEVWTATDPAGAAVALKVLLPHLSEDPTLRAMFLDEGRIAARLVHPNVVRTLEAGEASGRMFVAMELLEGMDLRRALRAAAAAEEPVPIAAALALGAAAARGLGYAHAARGDDGRSLDLVHRDVSPENLFLGRDGAVRVLDFGIARAKERLSETGLGVSKGKLGYLAPEQARGERVDARADIWALGAVLFEALALRPLHEDAAATGAGWAAPEVRDLRPEVSAGLAETVAAMLAVAPEARPASMRVVEGAVLRSLHELDPALDPRAAVADWAGPLGGERRRTRAKPSTAAEEVPPTPPAAPLLLADPTDRATEQEAPVDPFGDTTPYSAERLQELAETTSVGPGRGSFVPAVIILLILLLGGYLLWQVR